MHRCPLSLCCEFEYLRIDDTGLNVLPVELPIRIAARNNRVFRYFFASRRYGSSLCRRIIFHHVYTGSIKLKSYAARSLLPALLSPPAARKRQGVIDVLDAFPESRFLLVGDTGEQDLELYTELARERPHQVIGVFVRNVSTGPDHDVVSISARTGGGYEHADANFGLPLVDSEPEPMPSMPSTSSLNSLASSRLGSGSSSGMMPTRPPLSPYGSHSYSPRSPVLPSMLKSPRLLPRSRSLGGMSLEEKRRYDLDSRIDRARAIIPSHTAFRVFREPDECVEVQSILDRFFKSHQ